jgi:hypothetical protein
VLVAVHQFIAPLVSKSDTDTEVGTELETGGEITLTDLAAEEQVTTRPTLENGLTARDSSASRCNRRTGVRLRS